jgi:hypothetical protein
MNTMITKEGEWEKKRGFREDVQTIIFRVNEFLVRIHIHSIKIWLEDEILWINFNNLLFHLNNIQDDDEDDDVDNDEWCWANENWENYLFSITNFRHVIDVDMYIYRKSRNSQTKVLGRVKCLY